MNTPSETSQAPKQTPMQQVKELVKADPQLAGVVRTALSHISELIGYSGDEPDVRQPDGTFKPMDIEGEIKRIYQKVAVKVNASELIDQASRAVAQEIIAKRLQETTPVPQVWPKMQLPTPPSRDA